MKTLVIYATHFGNTKTLAEAIGEGLQPYGAARVVSVEEAQTLLDEKFDLLIFGGPTEQHSMTEPMKTFLDRLNPDTLLGTAVAVFDTRLQWPRWLSGSAALRIEERLRQAGAYIVAPGESFFIKGGGASDRHPPELAEGELGRARAWATSVGGARFAGAVAGSAPSR